MVLIMVGKGISKFARGFDPYLDLIQSNVLIFEDFAKPLFTPVVSNQMGWYVTVVNTGVLSLPGGVDPNWSETGYLNAVVPVNNDEVEFSMYDLVTLPADMQFEVAIRFRYRAISAKNITTEVGLFNPGVPSDVNGIWINEAGFPNFRFHYDNTDTYYNTDIAVAAGWNTLIMRGVIGSHLDMYFSCATGTYNEHIAACALLNGTVLGFRISANEDNTYDLDVDYIFARIRNGRGAY